MEQELHTGVSDFPPLFSRHPSLGFSTDGKLSQTICLWLFRDHLEQRAEPTGPRGDQKAKQMSPKPLHNFPMVDVTQKSM